MHSLITFILSLSKDTLQFMPSVTLRRAQGERINLFRQWS